MVIKLNKYVTISVPVEVKKRMERLKGNMGWGEFLLKLCEEYERLKREKKFRELVKVFEGLNIEHVEKESKLFRENFVLGEKH